MKILEYAFTSWNSIYLPYRYDHHCVVYTGTHDNPPVRAWIGRLNDGSRDFLRRYLNSMNSDYGQLTWDLIREAYRSTANLCVHSDPGLSGQGQEGSDECARHLRKQLEVARTAGVPVRRSCQEYT